MATTYTIPNRPINDSMSYNKNVNNRKPHFTPRVASQCHTPLRLLLVLPFFLLVA